MFAFRDSLIEILNVFLPARRRFVTVIRKNVVPHLMGNREELSRRFSNRAIDENRASRYPSSSNESPLEIIGVDLLDREPYCGSDGRKTLGAVDPVYGDKPPSESGNATFIHRRLVSS